MKRDYRWTVVLLIFVSVLISACGRAPKAAEKVLPASLEPIEGSEFKRVILTEKAAERIDLQTAPLRQEQVEREWIVGGEVVVAPQVEAAGAGPLWARVALDKSERSKVDVAKPARVLPLEGDDEEDTDEGQAGWAAEPDEGPADDDLAEVALYYAVTGLEKGIEAGQRVLVELPLLGSGEERKIVPFAALLYGVHGETWVYTNPEPLVFARAPVTVDYIEDEEAFLLDGPPVGTQVVTVGGSLLYGAETGVSK